MRSLGELLAGSQGRILAACWVVWVLDFHDLVLFAFLKDGIASELQLTLGQLAWIDGATLGASAVGGFLFGRIADRTSRRTALIAGFLCCTLGAGATALAQGLWSLALARVATGFGVGSGWGIGHALVAETFPLAQRNRAAGLLQAGGPAGMAIAATVGCLLGPVLGWRGAFAVNGAALLLVPWLLRVLPRTAAATRVAPAWRMLFARAHRRASCVLLALLALQMTGFWSVYAWLPALLLREAQATLLFVWLFQVSANCVHVLADLTFGWLADRVGRRRLFALTNVLFAVGLALVALFHAQLLARPLLFAAAIVLVGAGAGTWSAFGPWFAAEYPPQLRATAASGFYNLARGVQLFTQPMLGALFAAAGTLAVGLWVGVGCAVGAAVTVGGLAPPRDAPRDTG